MEQNIITIHNVGKKYIDLVVCTFYSNQQECIAIGKEEVDGLLFIISVYNEYTKVNQFFLINTVSDKGW